SQRPLLAQAPRADAGPGCLLRLRVGREHPELTAACGEQHQSAGLRLSELRGSQLSGLPEHLRPGTALFRLDVGPAWRAGAERHVLAEDGRAPARGRPELRLRREATA